MPLTRISLRKGKPPAYKRAICDQIYSAMRDKFDVPEDDRFMTISEHDEDEFDYGRSYLGIERTDALVIIQITANNTRSPRQKQALFKAIADRLADKPGIRREDVFISLVEVRKENWSFGLGEAQYA